MIKQKDFEHRLYVKLMEAGLAMSKPQVKRCLNAVLDSIVETVERDDKVTFSNFGSFAKVKRKARKARNVITGEIIDLPEKYSIKFTVSKALRERLNPTEE